MELTEAGHDVTVHVVTTVAMIKAVSDLDPDIVSCPIWGSRSFAVEPAAGCTR